MSGGVTEPGVLSLTRVGDEARLALLIQPELCWFEGHFRGTPLLPGVVQTHWAVVFGRRQFVLPPYFISMSNMKFSRFILPGMQIELQLNYAAAKRELSFEYREAAATCSSGNLSFAE